ncbi:MAG TPA: hypothetical protein VGA21_11740 [Cyclobacteriaceae bacterium]|jgi:hypothetical protein
MNLKIILLILIIASNAALSQNLQVLLTNSKDIDPHRYEGVRGSPYFFNKFVKGNIISNGAETFTDMILNYNAESSEFEIINEGKTVQLDKSIYMRVEILPEGNPELELDFPIIFQRGFNMKWLKKFGQMVYEGTTIKLIRDYTVQISSNEIQDVGKTLQNKRFVNLEEYFLLVEGELISIKLKKKKILNELEHSNQLEIYVKENKIDIETESGLRKILAYYETIK